jgi:hypothetical protein
MYETDEHIMIPYLTMYVSKSVADCQELILDWQEEEHDNTTHPLAVRVRRALHLKLSGIP